MRRTGEIFRTSNMFVKIGKWIKAVVDMKFWGTKAKGAMNEIYEGWNFNSGNYLFTTDKK